MANKAQTDFLRYHVSKSTTAQKRDQRIRELRQEASRKASMANKRLERLERNGLKDTPAYKQWLESGGERFGIRGKTYNEVQKELARLNRFIDAETSTVKGTVRVLKDMAENTGIKYQNLTELKTKSAKFFELASKVEQYLRTVDDMASAIGYQKIWEAINTYVKNAKIDLADSRLNIDQMIGAVTDALKEHETPINLFGVNWYRVE